MASGGNTGSNAGASWGIGRDPAIQSVLTDFSVPLRGVQTRDEELFDYLMPRRVRNILFVASLYDSFIFEEDGNLTEVLSSRAQQWNISESPHIHRVSNAEEALAKLKSKEISFQLVISLLRVGVKDIFKFLLDVKRVASNVPVLLLASNTRELTLLDPRVDQAFRLNVHKRILWEAAEYHKEVNEQHIWTWPFVWTGDARLLLAMVKTVEDRLNVFHDIQIFPDLQIIIVVEDGVKFYSFYLPLLYEELIKQTQLSMTDDYSIDASKARINARPKILLTTSFEEAMDIYQRYRNNIMAVITDNAFPKNGKHHTRAGLELAKLVKQLTPSVPILFQTGDVSIKEEAKALGVVFVDKSSHNVLHALKNFMSESLGFGPFVFRDEKGAKLMQANDFKSLIEGIRRVPDETILRHGKNNQFSNWLKARGQYQLSRTFRSKELSEFTSVSDIREFIVRSILELREEKQEGMVSDFSVDNFDLATHFARLGKGSLGGKGRGIGFINALLKAYDLERAFPHFRVSVPRTLVITTSVFDSFLNESLFELSNSDATDEAIAKAFVAHNFDTDVVNSLRHFLYYVKTPIAVRSSSLFEDAFYQPFAGVYESFMLPNNHPDIEERLLQLMKAMKLVYASLYYRDARKYAESVSYRVEELKMAVIIQEIAGSQQGNYFYPHVAGVARAINFYPIENMDPDNGVALLALGLGETVVNGGQCVRFSPGHPDRPYKYPSNLKRFQNSQKVFSALDLSPKAPTNSDKTGDDIRANVVRLPIEVSETHGALTHIGSVYIESQDFVSDNLSLPGPRMVTMTGLLKPSAVFNPRIFAKSSGLLQGESESLLKLLKSTEENPSSLQEVNTDPTGLSTFPRLLLFLLKVASSALSFPVEIEYALHISSDPKVPHQFSFLQCRPMGLLAPDGKVELSELPGKQRAVCATKNALGHGRIRGVRDVVYVKPSYTLGGDTASVLEELLEINKFLSSQNRPYILIGPGRWGDETGNGIPVSWGHINGATCIVDVDQSGVASLSEGSHFFQNITTFGIAYFSIAKESDLFDLEWLEGISADGSTGLTLRNLRHVAVPKDLEIVVDGATRCGVIYKPGSEYDAVDGQASSFLRLSKL